MSYRSLVAIAAMALLTAPALINCSSTPAPAEDEELVQEFDTPPAETAEAFESGAHWVHADSVFVATAVHEGLWDLSELAPLFLDHGPLQPGEPGTQEALSDDVAEAMIEELGFVPSNVDAYVLGYTEDTVTGVLFGDFGEIQGLTAQQVGSHRIYELPNFMTRSMANWAPSSFYLLSIDSPRPGIAVATDAELLAQLADGEDTLATSEKLHEYEAFFQRDDATFAAATLLDEYMEPFDESAPYPDALSISFGSYLELMASSDAETLDELEALVDQGLSNLREETQRIVDQPRAPLPDRLLATLGLHLGTSIDERHGSERLNDELLRYELELVEVEDDSIYASPMVPNMATLALLNEIHTMAGSPPLEPAKPADPVYEEVQEVEADRVYEEVQEPEVKERTE